ncbi:MAG: hypothetical protein GXN98_03750 [Euryarchaeota archaeon]|nr:hypothetical protein [Euryarchaeota archaeon]
MDISILLYIVAVLLLLMNAYHYYKIRALESELKTLKSERERIREALERLKSRLNDYR